MLWAPNPSRNATEVRTEAAAHTRAANQLTELVEQVVILIWDLVKVQSLDGFPSKNVPLSSPGTCILLE